MEIPANIQTLWSVTFKGNSYLGQLGMILLNELFVQLNATSLPYRLNVSPMLCLTMAAAPDASPTIGLPSRFHTSVESAIEKTSSGPYPKVGI